MWSCHQEIDQPKSTPHFDQNSAIHLPALGPSAFEGIFFSAQLLHQQASDPIA
jgi:hypothetical protein